MVGTAAGLLVFGGDSDSGQAVPDELWMLSTLPTTRPGAVLRFPLAATRVEGAAAALRRLSVSVLAGGRGFATDLDAADGALVGEERLGVALHRWTGTGWEPLATSPAGPEQPASLRAVVEAPAELAATIDKDVVVVRVEPEVGVGNGPAPSELQLDFAGAVLDLQQAP